MTEISEAAKMKAQELFNAAELGTPFYMTFARFIQQVSDACNEAWDLDCFGREYVKKHLTPFILPEPVDPLVEILKEYENSEIYSAEKVAVFLRAELAKRGLKIVEDKS